MVSLMVKRQLYELLYSMYKEGVLDQELEYLRSLQEQGNPGFIADLLTGYCKDTEWIITVVGSCLNRPIVDYPLVTQYMHQLKGSSTSIGCVFIKAACSELQYHSERTEYHGCVRGYEMIRNEYYRIQGRLQTIIELEEKMLAAGPATPPL